MTTRTRKLAAGAAALTMALSLAACGGDDADEAVDDAEDAADDAVDDAEDAADDAEDAADDAVDDAEDAADGEDDDAAPAEVGDIAEAAGFDGSQFTVGIITDQTGPVAVIGTPLTNGLEVYFQAYNEREGGVAGQFPIVTEVTDSQYNASTGVQQYDATKDDVVISSTLGTPVTLAILEQMKGDGTVGAPASLDSFWAREPNLLPVGAPYQAQAINATYYAYNNGGAVIGEDTFCTLLQDDAYGESALQGLEFASENMDLEIAVETRYTNGDTDFTTQVTELQSGECDVVFLNSTPGATGTILGTAAELGYAPQWYGQSPSWIGALAESPVAPYMAENFTWVSEGTEWGDTSVPGMEQMIADVEQYAPDQAPDPYFIFGYNQASAIASLLEEAVANGDVSSEGLMTAMESMTTDFGGLLADWEYGPADTRTPPTMSSFFEIAPDSAETGGLKVIDREIEAPFIGDFEYTARG